MKTSLSFLASDIAQMPPPGVYGNDGVEAVSFNRSDLADGAWQKIWRNVSQACATYGAGNVTYHFPVNDSDYVQDPEVYARL